MASRFHIARRSFSTESGTTLAPGEIVSETLERDTMKRCFGQGVVKLQQYEGVAAETYGLLTQRGLQERA